MTRSRDPADDATTPARRTDDRVGWGGALTDAEAVEIGRALADLVRAGQPVPSGLMALAEELPGGRQRAALRGLARRMERGLSPEAALAAEQKRFPAHLQALVAAGARSGRLAEVLAEFVRARQAVAELRRGLVLNLAYPLTLLGLFLGVLTLVLVVIDTTFADFMQGEKWRVLQMGSVFPVSPLMATTVLLVVAHFTREVGLWLALTVLVLWCLAMLAWRFLLSPPARCRAAIHAPLVGPIVRWTTLAEFCHLLAVLLDNEVPLPAAVELAGRGGGGGGLAAESAATATALEQGEPLSGALARRRWFPPEFGPLLRWAEGNRALPQALRFAGSLFLNRASTSARFLGAAVALLTALIVFFGLFFLVFAMYFPIIRILLRM